jgi:hypothetical protein
MECMFPNCDRQVNIKRYIRQNPFCMACEVEIEIALEVMREVIEVYPFIRSHSQFLTGFMLRFPEKYTNTRTPQYLYALKIANPPNLNTIMRQLPETRVIRFSRLNRMNWFYDENV